MSEPTEDEELEPYENTLSLEELRREVRRCWDRENALTKALRELPEVPHWRVMRLLSRAAKWPDDHNIGKRLQMISDDAPPDDTEGRKKIRRHDIPYKSEYEGGAGLWSRIRAGLISTQAR